MGRAKPAPPRPTNVRAVIAVATAIGAVVFGVPAMLVVTHPGDAGRPFEERVDAYLQELDRHQDLPPKIDRLTQLAQDPAFSKLPPAKQQAVRSRLHELSAFRDYNLKLNAIPHPEKTASEAELQEILSRLLALGLSVPAEYSLSWGQTDGGRRFDALRKEAQALHTAVHDTRLRYQKLVEDGRQVLNDPDGLDLPGRARAVMQRAQKAPTPETPGAIPGSPRLGYTAVFRFPEVAEVYQDQWLPLRNKLKPLAELRQP
jgi:hypothetical protein